jgi:hypothetical protein
METAVPGILLRRMGWSAYMWMLASFAATIPFLLELLWDSPPSICLVCNKDRKSKQRAQSQVTMNLRNKDVRCTKTTGIPPYYVMCGWPR